jgi:hypothetical protein
MVRARMGIRAHPTLADRPRRRAILAPSLAVAPGSPFVHLLIPSRRPRWGSNGTDRYLTLLNLHIHRRLREAISSEPPSLACPIQADWRVRVAERAGVHLLGEPEQADLRRHWAWSLAGSRGRGRGRPTQYAQACWQARWQADCDALSAWKPARSRATRRESPRRGAAG